MAATAAKIDSVLDRIDPTQILPNQWKDCHGCGVESSPERQLWLAVLVTAFQDASLPRSRTSMYGSGKHGSADARHWIMDNSREVRSFIWVCEQLSIDAVWLRNRLPTYRPTRHKVADIDRSGIVAIGT